MLPTPAPYALPNERDQEIFAATVPADHYLRRVLAVIDFQRSSAATTGCYSDHLGRPAIEPVLLLKLEFLQYHYNLSDRQAIEQARYNMAFRYFLGLSLHSPLPHHTLLTVFRERLGPEKHQQVFEDIVAQARAHGLVKDRLRLKDATHILANIAIPSTVRLVAETRERLLEALRPYVPGWVATQEEKAAVIHTTTLDLSGEERLLQRVTHLRAIVTWVDQLMASGPPAGTTQSTWQELQEVWRLAHQVLSDREPSKSKGRSPSGGTSQDYQRKDRLVSLQDTDARWGEHHGRYVGYLLDVTEDADSDLVTAVNVLPANGNEAADTQTLIAQEERAQGNDVQMVSLDGIGFRGEVLRDLTNPEGLDLEVIVPPRTEPEPTGCFTVEQFTPSAGGKVMTCPAGQTSEGRVRNRHNTGWSYRFARKVCAACPLLEQCMKKLPGAKGRQVSTNDYATEYAAARAKAQTPEYREIRRLHRGIERKLGEMVRWHRARRARYRSQPRVLIQALLTGLVVNVKRVVQMLTASGVRAELQATG